MDSLRQLVISPSLVLIVLMTSLACQSTPGGSQLPDSPPAESPTSAGSNPELEAEYSLRLEESVTLDDNRLTLTFVEVPRDNRCPTGVQCIVGGEAVVAFDVRTESSEARLTFAVGAQADPKHAVDGYEIEVLAVEPYPTVDRQITAKDYITRFVVNKL